MLGKACSESFQGPVLLIRRHPEEESRQEKRCAMTKMKARAQSLAGRQTVSEEDSPTHQSLHPSLWPLQLLSCQPVDMQRLCLNALGSLSPARIMRTSHLSPSLIPNYREAVREEGRRRGPGGPLLAGELEAGQSTSVLTKSQQQPEH